MLQPCKILWDLAGPQELHACMSSNNSLAVVFEICAAAASHLVAAVRICAFIQAAREIAVQASYCCLAMPATSVDLSTYIANLSAICLRYPRHAESFYQNITLLM